MRQNPALKKLVLHRLTVRSLNVSELVHARGGQVAQTYKAGCSNACATKDGGRTCPPLEDDTAVAPTQCG